MGYYRQVVGKKCYLSPSNVEDAELYCQWLNDLNISMQLGMTFSITPDEEKEILAKLRKENRLFGIIDKETDKLIGNTGLHQINQIDQTAEFGIFIGDKSYWNRGFGQEATQLTLDFGFNLMNLHNIYLRVYDYNQRGIRCYEKCGFKKIGVFREARQIAGKRHNVIYMDILNHEFESIYVKNIIKKE